MMKVSQSIETGARNQSLMYSQCQDMFGMCIRYQTCSNIFVFHLGNLDRLEKEEYESV